MSKKWLINVSEGQHTRKATLNTGRSLKQILIWCWFVPCVFSQQKTDHRSVHIRCITSVLEAVQHGSVRKSAQITKGDRVLNFLQKIGYSILG